MVPLKGTKNFAKFSDRVLIADKIGLNGGHLLRTYLWVLQRPHRTPKLKPLGLSFL